MKSTLIAIGGAFGVGTILTASYYYFIQRIDQNSSLVKQSLHNLNYIESIKRVTGGNCQVASHIRGEMLQRKGFASIDFEVLCKKGQFAVAVDAFRRGMDWRTENIALHQNGQEIFMVKLR